MLVWARCTRRTLIVVGSRPLDLHPGWEVQVTAEELLAHVGSLVSIDAPSPHSEEVIVLEDDEP